MKNTVFKLMAAAVFSFSACESDDPVIPNEEELITTLEYTLSPVGGGGDVVLTFQDLDGDGGDTPTISGGVLMANQSYTGAIELLNESEDPAERITTEIEAEDDAHQFFFESTFDELMVAYDDQDGNGKPVGLKTMLSTDSARGSGSITITLRHEPNKAANGVSAGDITNAGGETDIEVTFPLEIR